MSRIKTTLLLLALAVASALSSPAVAQPAPPPAAPAGGEVPVGGQAPAVKSPVLSQARFEALRKNTLRIRGQTFEEVARASDAAFKAERDQARRRDPFPSAALQAPALNRASAVTAIELATAAVSTSVDGAEAGVSVAPLALAGLDRSPLQVNLTFAALKDAKTEYGMAAAYQTIWDPGLPQDIGLESCKFDEKRQKAMVEAIDDLRFPLQQVCELMDTIASTPGVTRSGAMDHALAICKAPACTAPERGGVECEGLNRLVTDLKAALKELRKSYEAPGARIGQGSAEWLRLEEQIHAARASVEDLTAFQEKKYSPPDCFKASAIGDAVVQANWSHPRYRVGLGATFDLFPRAFGFNPDPSTKLPAGDLSKFAVRAEWARTTGAFELHLGVGVGRSRSDVDKPLYSFISPSISLTGAVASLSSEPLYKDGKLNVVNGAAPPRFALGVDAQLEYGLTHPDTQATSFQSVALTGYADFRFTDKLGVRVGVPLTAKLVTRKADPKQTPPVTEQTDLQWSVPVFATTVLKL